MERAVLWFGRHRAVALLAALCIALAGAIGLRRLPVDAVPDVTNNQVQVVTSSPALPATDVERRITLPVERAMTGLPGLRQVRSISRFGISFVTLIFDDGIDLYFARAQVNERLAEVRAAVPEALGRPEIGPVATGLGEIYLFELHSETLGPEALRTMLDWQIGPRLRQVEGVVETVHFGGAVKQYRVTLTPARMAALRVSIDEVERALRRDNASAGGGVIERNGEQVVLRAEARYGSLDEIRATVVRTLDDGTPLTVGMLGEVDTGGALRHGAMTADGKGETVGGSVLMRKGENGREVVAAVRRRVAEINATLPKGTSLVPVLDRADFIDRTVATIVKNLLEGAAVVVLVLLLTLGSARAGLLTAGAIPFAMLTAFAGLSALGMSANVMSLGAVDFGIIVEGTVVVTEHALHAAAKARSEGARRRAILEACAHTARPVLFAVVIVALVFLPLATLEDVEGKMFRPVVASLVSMLIGALFYALVVVPAVAPALLARHAHGEDPWLLRTLRAHYAPLLARAIARPRATVALAALASVLALLPAAGLGAEFLPRIFEGNFAIDARRPVSTSVVLAVDLSRETERALLEVPEVERVLSRIGRTEGSIDPSGPEATDVFVILAPRAKWRAGLTPEGLVAELDAKLRGRIPATVHAFSQPIEMRVNDLIAGVRAEVAVKVYGEDLATIGAYAETIRQTLAAIPGAADVRREVPDGLPSLRVVVDRERAARHGVAPDSILAATEAVRAGRPLGEVFEDERSFELVLRVGGEAVRSSDDLERLPIPNHRGDLVPLGAVAAIVEERGIAQIGRENLRRRLLVEANVRGRDLVGFVAEAQRRVAALPRPAGVELEWGGQFENFGRARRRLSLLVPVAFCILAVMLQRAYRSTALMAVTMLTLPFAVGGGVVALSARGLPFSVPAAVGFIALAGASVMGGSVMTARLLETDRTLALTERVRLAAMALFRPMLSTTLLAALGFVPMAIASGAGAEVQRPLATVVIGGLLLHTLLALFAMPVMALFAMRWFGEPTTATSAAPARSVATSTSTLEAEGRS
jgi:cobalt-zinc-cadmium resistance protein CzcA